MSNKQSGLLPWLRSFFYYLFMVPSLILLFFGLILVLPFEYKYRAEIIRWWALFQMWLLKVFCGLSYEVQGAENLPATSYIA